MTTTVELAIKILSYADFDKLANNQKTEAQILATAVLEAKEICEVFHNEMFTVQDIQEELATWYKKHVLGDREVEP